MKAILLFTVLFLVLVRGNCQGVPLGQWRDHLPYDQVIGVTSNGSLIYAATKYAVFTYDPSDNSIERLTKVNALSDVNISTIAFNQANGTVLVGYTNGNLDLIKGNTTTNISSIKNSTISGDKGIYNIHNSGTLAYLATGFGIIVIDVSKLEVKDTYIIGSGGVQERVNDVTLTDTKIYASTASGVLEANLSNPFLSDFTQWTSTSSLPLGNIEYGDIEYFDNRLWLVYNGPSSVDDSLYHQNGTSWSREATLTADDIKGIKISSGILLVSQKSYSSRISAAGVLDDFIFSNSSRKIIINDSYFDGTLTYIGDEFIGLVKSVNSWSSEVILPTGPIYVDNYSLKSSEGDVWVTGGNLTPASGLNFFSSTGAWRFSEETWTTFNKYTLPGTAFDNDSSYDYTYVAIDPSNPKKVFLSSSSRAGLLELNETGVQQVFNQTNSSLQERNGITNYYELGEGSFDEQGNLWIPNSRAQNPLSVYTTDGNWKSFNCGASLPNIRLTRSIVDRNNYVWVVAPGSGVFVYNPGSTPTNASDDQYKLLNTTVGNGGLPDNTINCIAEDLDGEIWVGTAAGPAIFYNSLNIFASGSFDAQQILIEQDGNVQLLLETEVINAIAIDGANRKWIGTQSSGVFLISEDGTEQIFHFTEENSPLPSNEIRDIAIDGKTGEVFFGSLNGIVSYKAKATQGDEQFNSVYAFPNPVRPEYQGDIVIRGLMRDSDVKITDLSGHLVFQTTSFGGQAIWNGQTFDGQRVKTGIYLVFAADQQGNNATVAKIAFVN